MKSHWTRRQTCGAFVVARGVRLNIGRAVSRVNSVACCKWILIVNYLWAFCCQLCSANCSEARFCYFRSPQPFAEQPCDLTRAHSTSQSQKIPCNAVLVACIRMPGGRILPVAWILFLKIVLKESAVVNRPGREAYHKPPSSAEMGNECSCTRTAVRRRGVDGGSFIVKISD
jgi:hypothetical protein